MFRQLSGSQKRPAVITAKRREAVSAYLLSEDLLPDQIQPMLNLVDLYGLLYSALPKRGTTRRDIYREAEAAALMQRKKTRRALQRVDAQERHAKSEAAAELTRKKVRSQLYQRVRGPAVISRLAAPADRQRELKGR